jgi:hypothetical protein
MDNMRWAIINLETNIVENVIIWDGNTNMFPFPVECLIQLNENENCGPRYKYDPNAEIRFFEDATSIEDNASPEIV